MKLIFIYGPPAVGKLTVATELGRITSFAVFDNHMSINCVLPVFAFGTDSMNKLVRKIRLDVIEEAAREGVDVVFTFVYAHIQDTTLVEEICDVVAAHNGTVCFVQILCDTPEQEHRVAHPDRARRMKTRSVELVRDWNARLDLFSPVPNHPSLTIDNTHLAPAEVARRIAAHYDLPAAESR